VRATRKRVWKRRPNSGSECCNW